MIPDAIIVEIKRQLRRGYPHGEIITDLEKQGYNKQEIEKAILAASGYKGAVSSNSDISVWAVFGIGFLITAIAILGPFRNSGLGFIFLAAGIICFVVNFVQKQSSGKSR